MFGRLKTTLEVVRSAICSLATDQDIYGRGLTLTCMDNTAFMQKGYAISNLLSDSISCAGGEGPGEIVNTNCVTK